MAPAMATAGMTVATTAASTGMVPVTAGMKMAAMTMTMMTTTATTTTGTLKEMGGWPDGVDPNTHFTTSNINDRVNDKKKIKKKRKSHDNWNQEEDQLFLKNRIGYDQKWEMFTTIITTRTAREICNYVARYYSKIEAAAAERKKVDQEKERKRELADKVKYIKKKQLKAKKQEEKKITDKKEYVDFCNFYWHIPLRYFVVIFYADKIWPMLRLSSHIL